MPLFADALAAAREAVAETYAVAMTVMPMVKGGHKGASPDPDKPALVGRLGILHEHAMGRTGEAGLIERTDGGRPGGRFGIDMVSEPVRISFDVDALGGWVPPEGTRISIDGTARVFEVTHPGPTNAGRLILFVTEI